MVHNKVIVIAECGINHNGDISIAKNLIKKAHQAGADVVKFQKRTPEICVPSSQWDKIRNTPWGKITYIDYKRKMEFGKNEYDKINELCCELGIRWTASVWDIPSLDFIKQYDVPFIKIPSACITNIELLSAIAKTNKPVVMSTGMSTMEEVNRAFDILGNCDVAVLHCNSSYPCNDSEIDLNMLTKLESLKRAPEWKIGYSGHEVGIMPSIIAVALGAVVVERHITINKNMWGSDHKASLTPIEFKEMVDHIRKVSIWLGKDYFHVYDSEKKVKEKLRSK